MDARLDMRIAHDGQANVARRLAALLRRYERSLRSLIDWIDPSWLAGVISPGVVELAVDTAERAQLSLAVAERLGVNAPPFASFNTSATDVLAMLEVHEVLDLCRIRALLFRRAELRSWIDRPSRERVSQWAGHDATFFVRALQAMPDAPKVERLTRSGHAPELGALTASQLAWEGWNLFACDERTSERGPWWLLRFALPRDLDTTPWIAHRALFEERAYGPDNERVFLQLKHWFGQRTWSSGFDSLG